MPGWTDQYSFAGSRHTVPTVSWKQQYRFHRYIDANLWRLQYTVRPWLVPDAAEWHPQYEVLTGIEVAAQWETQYHFAIGIDEVPQWQEQYRFTPNITDVQDWQEQYRFTPNIPDVQDWREQYRLTPNIPDVQGWREQYRLTPNITEGLVWREQYRFTPNITVGLVWQEQYQLTPAISDVQGWQLQYRFTPNITDVQGWREQYRLRGGLPQPDPAQWRLQYTLTGVVGQPAPRQNWRLQYRLQRFGLASPGGRWWLQYALTGFVAGSPALPVAPGLYIDGADETSGVLRYSVRFGRSEAAYGAVCQSLQGQVTLNNSRGEYDNLRPNQKVELIWEKPGNVGAATSRMWGGWISDVRPSIDHRTGLRLAQVHIQGTLAQLARADYELALFLTDTVRTGQVVESVMDTVKRSDIAEDIDVGQVRIHPAHYTSVLSPRRLSNALAVLRATEQAEIGYLHEGRGDELHFEDRFHRELDYQLATVAFGPGSRDIAVKQRVEPALNWDNLYTVVEAGAEKAVVQATGRVYTLGGKSGGSATNKSWPIPAYSSRTFACNLVTDVHSREHENIASVASWATASHVLEPATLTATYAYTRTTARVTVTNSTSAAITMTKLELHGAGVALYGDLTLPPIEDADAIAAYGRRSLNLPVSFIGDGTNHEGDAVAEGRAYADMLLARYSQPIVTARLSFNPYQHDDALMAACTLAIGDPVTVAANIGLPSGVYYIEGMEFQHEGRTGETTVTAMVSKRGRSRSVINNAVSPGATAAWADVGSRVLEQGELYIIGADARFATGTTPSTDEDDTVLRVVNAAGDVLKAWAEQDIPVGAAAAAGFLGTIYRAAANDTAKVQVRYRDTARRPVVSRWRVIRTEI